MIFRQNMIVLITNGRLAGKKAVVVKELENDMLLVAGISRLPVESADFLPNWQKRRNEKSFINIEMDKQLVFYVNWKNRRDIYFST